MKNSRDDTKQHGTDAAPLQAEYMTTIAALLPTSSTAVMLVMLVRHAGMGAEAQALPMLRKPNRRLLPNKRKARPIVPPCTRNGPEPARHMAV
jgi:hypothetical protein